MLTNSDWKTTEQELNVGNRSSTETDFRNFNPLGNFQENNYPSLRHGLNKSHQANEGWDHWKWELPLGDQNDRETIQPLK